MKRLTLLSLLLLSCLSAMANPSLRVEQELVLSENPLPFGKPAELVITLRWEKGSDFELPPAEGLQIPEATMLDAYVNKGGGGPSEQAEYHLFFTHFKPGDFQVGPVTLPGTEFQTEPLTLSFAGATTLDTDKPDEIRTAKSTVPISTADFWQKLAKMVIYGLGGLTFFLLLLSYSGILDRFRSPKSRALRRLRSLSKRQLPPEEQLLQCIEILRDYLAQAYQLTTHTSTSQETLKAITLDNRCREWKSLAAELLQRGDQLKFAQGRVSPQEVADLSQSLLSTLQAEKKVSS